MWKALRSMATRPHLAVMDEPRNIKPDARLLVDGLPDSATWDDLAYEIYVRQSIERGLADSDAGRVIGTVCRGWSTDRSSACCRIR